MASSGEEFKLSASLRGHEEDVRAVVFPDQRTIFSASRDNTVRKWSQTHASPPTYDDTIAIQGNHWFNGLAYTPSSKSYPEGLIAAGGRETFLYVKQPGKPPEEDPERLLIGHAHNICSIAFSEDGSKVVSGAWDSQAFVWDVEKGEVSAELQGHGGNVWGVLVYDSKLVLTACADKLIRVFDLNGKHLHTISGHTDVVRTFCRLPPGHWSGAAFASAGNDQIIRLWTLDGTAMGELHGHTEYIYALDILPSGDIVSSGEDRTVRIWRNAECIQTIIHPALSIWSVAVCPETGDIVSGASDKIVRVWSRNPERQADQETLKSFDDLVKSYAIPQETASQAEPFQKDKLPGPEALQTQVGSREGQQLFIRDGQNVTAYMWSAATSQWNLIGTVVQGQGSSGSKKTHNGKEYDFVFDIDIEEGKPPLKLPYNIGQDEWAVARKFLEDNELPMTYLEQVANWINQNTQGAKLGSQAPPSQAPASDPWGSDKRYRPGDAGSSGPRKLPQRNYLPMVAGKPQDAVARLVGLGEPEAAEMKKLGEQLQNNPTDPQPQQDQVHVLLKAIGGNNKSRVPAVALLALCAVSPAFIQITSSGNNTIIEQLAAAGVFELRQESPNNAVQAIRVLANLLVSDPGRLIADGSFDKSLQLARNFAAAPESAGQAKALAALYLNYAVLLTSGAPSQESASRESRAEILIVDIATLLENSDDNDTVLRSLYALGTLLTLGDNFRNSMKGGLAGTLTFVTQRPSGQQPAAKEMIAEIRDEMR